MIYQGDALSVLKSMADESVHCCVTSPPYWGLRDYGVSGQLGLEKTPEEYVEKLKNVFREVRRALRKEGTLWLNLGDTYNARREGGHPGGGEQGKRAKSYAQRRSGCNVRNLKPKDLVGIPWRVAFALQADGWYLRSEIIWHKPNPMPESVTDRPTKAHEYIFLFAKSQKYFYDADAIREPYTERRQGKFRPRGSQPFTKAKIGSPVMGNSGGYPQTRLGKNRRTVWRVIAGGFRGAHFATFPEKLIEPCILAGCPEGGTVLDPFFGAGTTGVVAYKNRRDFIGIELNEDYVRLATERLRGVQSEIPA